MFYSDKEIEDIISECLIAVSLGGSFKDTLKNNLDKLCNKIYKENSLKLKSEYQAMATSENKKSYDKGYNDAKQQLGVKTAYDLGHSDGYALGYEKAAEHARWSNFEEPGY